MRYSDLGFFSRLLMLWHTNDVHLNRPTTQSGSSMLQAGNRISGIWFVGGHVVVRALGGDGPLFVAVDFTLYSLPPQSRISTHFTPALSSLPPLPGFVHDELTPALRAPQATTRRDVGAASSLMSQTIRVNALLVTLHIGLPG